MLEFSKIQDEVPSFPFPEVEESVKEELRIPVDRIFSSFEKLPLAAASIGQVHKAKMPVGKNVVIKIRRPGY